MTPKLMNKTMLVATLAAILMTTQAEAGSRRLERLAKLLLIPPLPVPTASGRIAIVHPAVPKVVLPRPRALVPRVIVPTYRPVVVSKPYHKPRPVVTCEKPAVVHRHVCNRQCRKHCSYGPPTCHCSACNYRYTQKHQHRNTHRAYRQKDHRRDQYSASHHDNHQSTPRRHSRAPVVCKTNKPVHAKKHYVTVEPRKDHHHMTSCTY